MEKRRGCPPGGWPSQVAKKKALAAVTATAAPQAEPGKVGKLEALPQPQADLPTFSFALEHVGQNLWRVVMLTHSGDKVLERKYVSEGDLKGNALARLRFCVYQLWFNEHMPDRAEIMPTQSVSHG